MRPQLTNPLTLNVSHRRQKNKQTKKNNVRLLGNSLLVLTEVFTLIMRVLEIFSLPQSVFLVFLALKVGRNHSKNLLLIWVQEKQNLRTNNRCFSSAVHPTSAICLWTSNCFLSTNLKHFQKNSVSGSKKSCESLCGATCVTSCR